VAARATGPRPSTNTRKVVDRADEQEYPISLLTPKTPASSASFSVAIALEEIGMKREVIERYHAFEKGLAEAEKAQEELTRKLYGE
jgi:hypothetical protein